MRQALEGLRSLSATVYGGVLPKAGDSRSPTSPIPHKLSISATPLPGKRAGGEVKTLQQPNNHDTERTIKPSHPSLKERGRG